MFPDGVPVVKGVAGWAMLHKRVTVSGNVFQDARYDRLREFAALVGYVSAAAAPIELDEGKHGALVICYPEEREFAPEELARLERLARQTEIALRSVRQRESLSRLLRHCSGANGGDREQGPYTGGHRRRLADHAALVAAVAAAVSGR
jgi:GAF domain-containing protein